MLEEKKRHSHDGDVYSNGHTRDALGMHCYVIVMIVTTNDLKCLVSFTLSDIKACRSLWPPLLLSITSN